MDALLQFQVVRSGGDQDASAQPSAAQCRPALHRLPVCRGLTMGLFRRRRGHKAEKASTAANSSAWQDPGVWMQWEAPRNWIVGESYHPDELLDLAGAPRDEGYIIPVCVDLVREPENPHDVNAIRASVCGLTVGHVQRDIAEALAEAMDDAGMDAIAVCGLIRGGFTARPNLGVHVWLDRNLRGSVTPPLPKIVSPKVRWPPEPDELDGYALPAVASEECDESAR